ncbi:archease [Rhodothermus profundi]|nr:archease [Rhodothermus profundi]
MEQSRPSWFRELDHTADTGIEVWAQSLPELFERAAWGLFAILTDPETVTPQQEVSFNLEASDVQALLVRWLSELNYYHITRRWVFSRFEVQRFDEQRLHAQAWGEPIDPARHTIYTEVKAITYHGLTLRRQDGQWYARIIFDL